MITKEKSLLFVMGFRMQSQVFPSFVPLRPLQTFALLNCLLCMLLDLLPGAMLCY